MSLILLGIVIFAFGSYVVSLGTKVDNSISEQSIINQINQFNKDLHQIESNSTNDVGKAAKLDELNNEFDKWALDLKENYPDLNLSLNKLKIELSEKELTLAKEWKPFYSSIFDNIEKMILSINKGLNDENKILATKNSDFPQSLFQDEEEDYSLIMTFNETNYWKIRLFRFSINQNNLSLPFIQITYSNINDLQKFEFIRDSFTIHFNRNSTRCEANGYFKFIDTEQFSEEISIKNVNEILKSCLQYQLLQISPPNPGTNLSHGKARKGS
ncbi:MAG: hypothetical protein JWR09_2425 [Mucilaginibacter sp.]|nr:hypothetical protein [Mucilaginibacter sp.]